MAEMLRLLMAYTCMQQRCPIGDGSEQALPRRLYQVACFVRLMRVGTLERVAAAANVQCVDKESD